VEIDMSRRVACTVAAAVAVSFTAGIVAANADPRAVVELFTSQGCSSCPDADRLAGELSEDSSLVVMSLPIDYWDYLGWKDTLADSRFSARQKAYSRARGDREVYTPQAIVNGSAHVIGSDLSSIQGAIGETEKADGVMSVPVTMTQAGKLLTVSIAASAKNSAVTHGEVWICSISKEVPILISRGENSGREITYHNVVRNLMKVGEWNGGSGSWTVPIESVVREGADGAVVYLQDGSRDKPGPMLGAAYTSLH